jgi:hypothetical protein
MPIPLKAELSRTRELRYCLESEAGPQLGFDLSFDHQITIGL